MSSNQRVVDVLIRLFPRAWRDRYGDEMRVLVEDAGLSASGALNLVIGAAREWLASPPDGHAGFVFLIVVGELVNISGALVGCLLRGSWELPSFASNWLTVGPRLAVMLIFVPVAFGLRPRGWPFTFNRVVTRWLIAAVWLAVVAKAWASYSLGMASWRAHATEIFFDAAGVVVVLLLKTVARGRRRPSTRIS